MSDLPHVHDIRIHTQADLERTWRQLMEPLGFGGTSLWVMPVEPDGRLGPLIQLEGCEGELQPWMAEKLAGLLRNTQGHLEESGARWAMLRTRPGHDGASALDRRWARELTTACAAAGLATETVHLATDRVLVPLPPDDVLSAAG